MEHVTWVHQDTEKISEREISWELINQKWCLRFSGNRWGLLWGVDAVSIIHACPGLVCVIQCGPFSRDMMLVWWLDLTQCTCCYVFAILASIEAWLSKIFKCTSRTIQLDWKNHSTSLTSHFHRVIALRRSLKQPWGGYNLCLAANYRTVGSLCVATRV